jgi:hypothetical protein
MDTTKLLRFLDQGSMDWLMTPSERLVVVAMLDMLRPRSTLELGYGYGGCTAWLSHYSQEVITVDWDTRVLASSQRFPNVTPLHMNTEEAIARLTQEGRHFDLAFVDAYHSFDMARIDLRGVLPLADVILLHDTTNPPCRFGFLDALKDLDCFYYIDLVEGHLQDDGLWGGLGIVLPGVPRKKQMVPVASEPTFHILHARCLEMMGQPKDAESFSPKAPKRKWLRKLVRILKGAPD